VNYGVGRDWYEWAYDRLCDLGSHSVSCIYQCPGMEGVLNYSLHSLIFQKITFLNIIVGFGPQAIETSSN
jgi:hypothetical protein